MPLQILKWDANFAMLICLSDMGVAVAIKSSMNNKTHKKLESEQEKIKNFFSEKTKDTVEW